MNKSEKVLKYTAYLLSCIGFRAPIFRKPCNYLFSLCIKIVEPEAYYFANRYDVPMLSYYADGFNSYYVFDRKRKLVYLTMYKVACSAIINTFFATDLTFSQLHFENLTQHNKNIKVTKNPFKFIPNFRHAYFFTFVRNPFDRLYSAYQYNLLKEGGTSYLLTFFKEVKSFDVFVKKLSSIPEQWLGRHFMSCYQQIYSVNTHPIDFIGKFEELEQQFEPIRHKYNLENLIKINSMALHKDEYKDHYTEELVHLVYHQYKKDFDTWYPNAYQEMLDYVNTKDKKVGGGRKHA